eukprot:TRINITY_DN3641_c0_g1_i1.p1 TRINITY_DN3641_c0_g1~~TRINITY_DN3641_c0_g1_i1.p1  ORF type:complete len:922 (+),score=171.43 TRINITY_DN3641_c0_g1_i1:673-3438(+)
MLKETVWARLLPFLDTQLHSEDKTSFEYICTHTQNILSEVWPPEKVTFAVEEFNMNYADRCLRKDNLERRLKGLQYLQRAVSKTVVPEEQSVPVWKSGLKDQAPKKPAVDPEYFLNFVKEREIMHRYFSLLGTHVEIVNQGLPFLVFLIHHGQFTLEHLDRIWESSVGIHEHDRKILFRCLSKLSSDFSIAFNLHLLHRIKETERSLIDEHLLDVIAEVASVLSNEMHPEQFEGLKVLWEVITNKSAVVSTRLKAVGHLSNILNRKSCENQKITYISLCLQNYSDAITAELLQKLIETVSTKKGQRSKMIEELERQYKLTDLIFNKLANYKKEIEAVAKTTLKKDPKYQLDNLPTGNGISHIEHINRQLSFIDYIYANSSLTFSESRVDIIWTLLVERSLTSTEKETTLTWFSEQVSNMKVGDTAISEYIFNKILALDTSQFSYTVFTVFMSFFLLINQARGSVKTIDTIGVTEKHLRISAHGSGISGIAGIETLWQILVTGTHELVIQEAMRTFIALFHNVDQVHTKAKALGFRKEFVNFWASRLAQKIDSKSKQQGDSLCLGLHRMFALIISYTEEGEREKLRIEQEIAKQRKAEKGMEMERADVLISVKKDKDQKQGRFRLNCTILEVKSRCRRAFELNDNDYIRLYFENQELRSNDRTISDYGIHKHKDPVFQLKVTDPEEKPIAFMMLSALHMGLAGAGLQQTRFNRLLNQIDSSMDVSSKAENWLKSVSFREKIHTYGAPVKHRKNISEDLANLFSDHFKQFFKILDLQIDPDISSQVLDLLRVLPLNAQIVNDFKTLSEGNSINWDQHLDPNNTYKLAYTLYVIECLIETPDERINWKSLFRSQNIIDRLLTLVCSTDIKSRNAKKVLRYLLTVTTLLLVTEDTHVLMGKNSQSPVEEKRYDTKQLVQIQKNYH